MFSISLQQSHTIKNIRSKFHKTGTSNYDEWQPPISKFEQLLSMFSMNTPNLSVTLHYLCDLFEERSPTFLCTPVIEVSTKGTIRLKLSSGVHLKSKNAIDALNEK